jgi:2-iminobutanoate/2-iminopropanoate deaminase
MPYVAINAPDTTAPPPKTWTHIKVHGNGHFYVSGMAAPGVGMYEQAKGTFESIRRTIAAAGGVMDDIMSMQIFVTNLDENTEVWRARREFFTGDYPASTLIQVVRVGSPSVFPPMRIEINCSGYIGGSR